MSFDHPKTNSSVAPAGPAPGVVLIQLIMIWAALLLGQIVFGVVVVVARDGNGGTDDTAQLLQLISLGMVVVGTPIAYFVRSQIYKANWRNDVITPGGYVVGNIVFFAILEAASMIGLVAAMLGGSLWLSFGATGIAMLVQIINFPTGKPMLPHPMQVDFDKVNPYRDRSEPS